ncbi:MAG: hypothetical protein QW304_07550 [Thermoproteota archaeon]
MAQFYVENKEDLKNRVKEAVEIQGSLTLQTLFNGDYLTPSLGVCYVAILTVIVLYLASRFFSTGRVMTAKIRFKKRKTGE